MGFRVRLRACVYAAASAASASLLLGAAPAGGALALLGNGVQVYTCTAVGNGFVWHFTAPQARLLDAQGHEAGRHFAGPSWQADDGSIVVGEVAASSAGAPGSIPWLVLRAKSHTGAGLFASVTYIVRSQTVGGVAPTAGCDKSRLGAEARVAYSATYTFFPKMDAVRP